MLLVKTAWVTVSAILTMIVSAAGAWGVVKGEGEGDVNGPMNVIQVIGSMPRQTLDGFGDLVDVVKNLKVLSDLDIKEINAVASELRKIEAEKVNAALEEVIVSLPQQTLNDLDVQEINAVVRELLKIKVEKVNAALEGVVGGPD